MPKVLFPILLLLFATIVSAQEKYDFGKIDEIKGMSKVYVSADAKDRPDIIEELDGKGGLKVVDDVEDAEFFVSYQAIGTKEIPTVRLKTAPLEVGQMDVYLKKGERLRAVWLKQSTAGPFKDRPPVRLTKMFLKDFGKLNK